MERHELYLVLPTASVIISNIEIGRLSEHMNNKQVVVIGAGHAGFQVCASLRDEGFDGNVTLVGDEPQLPYERPPLSKNFLARDVDRNELSFRSRSFYSDNRIEVALGTKVVEIDRQARRVRLHSGAVLSYDHLVLAQGARNRSFPSAAAWPSEFVSLRTVEDAEVLKSRAARAQKVVVIGAGFVGLEIAATLAKQKIDVEIIDVMPRVMSRSVSGPISDFFQRAHLSWGAKLHCGCAVTRIERLASERYFLAGSDGLAIEADMIVIGIGVVPNTDLAFAAGLHVDNGIVVNSALVTNDQAISAIGDCANFPGPCGMERLESVQNAGDQARHVAAHLTGQRERYASVPWFWSEQNGLKLQIAGLTKGHTHTSLRGRQDDGSFSVFCFEGSRLLGIESVNRPADHIIGRRLIEADAAVTPEQAADGDFDLRSLLRKPAKIQETVA